MGSTGTGVGISPAAKALADAFGYTKGFAEGDTVKAIQDDKNYNLERTMADGKTRRYGSLPGTDVKSIFKGYKFNGLFWTKDNIKSFYTLQELD